jgi:hypothetical protein
MTSERLAEHGESLKGQCAHCNLRHFNYRHYIRVVQPWIADFAELVLIIGGKKTANAQDTAIWETIRPVGESTLPWTAWFLERDFEGTSNLERNGEIAPVGGCATL